MSSTLFLGLVSPPLFVFLKRRRALRLLRLALLFVSCSDCSFPSAFRSADPFSAPFLLRLLATVQALQPPPPPLLRIRAGVATGQYRTLLCSRHQSIRPHPLPPKRGVHQAPGRNHYHHPRMTSGSSSRRKLSRQPQNLEEEEEEKYLLLEQNPRSPKETDPLLPSTNNLAQQSGQQKQEQASAATSAASSTATPATTTTGRAILALAVPAAAALLLDPLLNLVDTALVGRFPPTAAAAAATFDTNTAADPLAGMGSAAALLTFSFYTFNFLCTATTPLIARKRAEAKAAAEQQQQNNISKNDATTAPAILAGQALSLALSLGSILAVFLLVFRQPLLLAMGTGQTGPGANQYAVTFLSIRALSAPAILCIEASVGILRGYLDTQTPTAVLLVANAVNLVLDVLFIVYGGLGPMGAAIATTTAEWISALLFLAVLAGKLPSATPEASGIGRGSGTVIVPARSVPPYADIRPLILASKSVFLRTLLLQASLSGAAAMAARSGVSSVAAAHQIGIQLWMLCSFFCDALAAASQGLVADAIGRNDRSRVVQVSQTVFAYSLVLGLGLAAVLQIGVSTGALVDAFTQDPATSAVLESILPLIVLAQPLNALVFAADGVLQGAAQFPFQARAMAVSGIVAVSSFVILQGLSGGEDTLPSLLSVTSNTLLLSHIWSALIALQFVRGLTSFYKLVDPDGPINFLSIRRKMWM
jgi:putative MATE family efflux protein